MDFDSLSNVTVGNHTQLGWVDGPDRRGTLSILISCIITLILCSWSAMHLNIPSRNESSASYMKTQGLWSLVAIFGPEMVIWSAWRQYICAKALRDQVRAALIESGTESIAEDEWTMTHGFYATMGGFVIDLDSTTLLKQQHFLRNISRVTLTPKGILLLAKCGHLPKVPQSEIQDKSKTDELGKLWACLQVLWMVAQVVSRLATKLPITLLEVSVMGHVLCALVVYALWWHKPRWISEPTRLEGDWIPMICAFMCMASQLDDGAPDETRFEKRFAVDTAEISKLRFICSISDSQPADSGSPKMSQEPDDVGSTRQRQNSDTGSFIFRPRTMSLGEKLQDIDIEITPLHSAMTIDSVTQYRHDLASRAIATYPAIRSIMRYPLPAAAQREATALRLYPEMPERVRRGIRDWPPLSKEWLECETEHLVALSASNWPTEGLLRPTGGLAMGTILWFSTIAFSAAHIAAWNDIFPTVVEAWLWRSSSIYLGFSGCLWSAVHVLAHASASFWWLWYDLLTGRGSKILKSVLIIICAICGAAYIFARLFLIVDSFASLRSLPAAAFLVPQWSASVPHI